MSIVCFIFCRTGDISFVNDPCRVCALLCISWCISPQPLSIIVCFIFCRTERDISFISVGFLHCCTDRVIPRTSDCCLSYRAWYSTVVQIVTFAEPVIVVCRTERDIPRGAPPHIPVVHAVRDFQLLPYPNARAGLQPLQRHRSLRLAPAHHHRLLQPHPLRDLQENQAKQEWVAEDTGIIILAGTRSLG